MHSLIIFASGKGSNAQAIIDHFKMTKQAKVALIVSNKADAGVLDIARAEHIPFLIVDKISFRESLFLEQLQSYSASLIVLAGFLWKLPAPLIEAYPNRILNIHPALLPNYGGKGMYGSFVHDAVLAAKEQESGITIHYVNEVYDSGNIILQARCSIEKNDDSISLANKIHKLEHFFYPKTVEYLLKQL